MYPKGFLSVGKNIGIKDQTKDFAVIFSEFPCKAAAVFTKNNFPGAPILVGQEHIQNGRLQAIVINSKNSNVATGEKGVSDAREICRVIAENLGISDGDVLPSSTGVIGVPLPISKILDACKNIKTELKPDNLEEVAEAIMTTDRTKKISFRSIGEGGKGTIYGIAKGAGMIEPNMATMLSFILTDVKVGTQNLHDLLKKVVDRTFNCLTIDSDTSTSDTVVLLSNEQSIPVSESEFEESLFEVCRDLTKLIARDGEGATKLIELSVIEARDESQARKIGKSILNSPLVKTAIYGGDPNWGRFVMAIGKVFDEKIEYEKLSFRLGGLEVKNADEGVKQKMSEYLKANTEIKLEVGLGQGSANIVLWGCDLTEDYIRENAYYTT